LCSTFTADRPGQLPRIRVPDSLPAPGSCVQAGELVSGCGSRLRRLLQRV